MALFIFGRNQRGLFDPPVVTGQLRGPSATSSAPSAPTLVSIAVSPTGAVWRPLFASERQQFTAIGAYSDTSTQDLTATVTWTSDITGSITISAGGEATPLTVGTGSNAAFVMITATSGLISGSTNIQLDTNRDELSMKRMPWTYFQWQMLISGASLAVQVPDGLRRFDELSGSVQDYIGSFALAPDGSTPPLYNQSVTGWAKTGLAMTGGLTQRVRNASVLNTATTSSLTLFYAGFNAVPVGGANRILIVGTGDDFSVTAGAAVGVQQFRYREASNIVQTTGSYTLPEIFPVHVQHDVTNSRVELGTNKERLTPTYGATAGTQFMYGADAGLAATVTFQYAVEWRGANAEVSAAVIKSVKEALGWTITYTT